MVKDLIDHLTTSLPVLPDEQIRRLVGEYQLSIKDARTLVALDDGERLDYFDAVVAILSRIASDFNEHRIQYGKTAANWY